DPALGYTFTAGQAVVYHNALGSKFPGLVDGTTYYAVVDANSPFYIQLATSQSEAMAASAALTARNSAANKTSTLVPTTVGSIQPSTSTTGTILYVDPGLNAIVLADPSPNFQTGDPVTFHQVVNNGIGGLTDNTVYYVIAIPGDANSIRLALNSTDAGNGVAITLDGNSRLIGTTAGDPPTLDVQNTGPPSA